MTSFLGIGLIALGITHVIPNVIPPQHQGLFALAKPALQWAVCGSVIAAGAPSLFCLASIPHAAMSALALLSVGMQNPLAQQLLYGPALGSLAAWLGGRALFHGAGTSAAVLFAIIQLVHVALGLVVTMLYPAPVVPSVIDTAKMRAAIERDPMGIQFVRVPVLQQPNTFLDAIVVPPSRELPKFGRRKYLLYVGGNGELFELTYQSIAVLADRLGVTIVMANPMGVGRSEGVTRNADDLVLAARSTVEWLLTSSKSPQQGVSRRDLVVFGHSIGGGVASRLVSQHYPECGLVLDRTFSLLSDAAISLSPVTKNPTFVRTVLAMTGFGDFDNVQHFQLVPHARKLITYHRSDQIIKFKESSIARLPQFQSGGESAHFVAELHSHKYASDAHNIGIADLDGFDVVAQRILSFYERSLADS